eukprot:CAMPEP_0194412484 /NCGR_PEP_ID=MMETSP0176-20130528/10968_1 /TAXON_ID=216777 /ORGANISM="Proboscia alata, Strain PI-D3" /LENGTH=256 /DNA_ID=CAMNT_0039215269 /DNA_START=8 /DNA_END=775 /DNA_ORIENTATION=+
MMYHQRCTTFCGWIVLAFAVSPLNCTQGFLQPSNLKHCQVAKLKQWHSTSLGASPTLASQRETHFLHMVNNDDTEPITGISDRRSWIRKSVSSVLSVLLVSGKANAALISSEQQNLESDNEFIRKLQIASEKNREQYRNEAFGLTGSTQSSLPFYEGGMKGKNYTALKRSDGTTQMVTPEELLELQNAGKIKMEDQTYLDKNGKEMIDYVKGKKMVLTEGRLSMTDSSYGNIQASSGDVAKKVKESPSDKKIEAAS